MAQIKIELSIDSSNSKEVNALMALLGQLNPSSNVTVGEPKTIDLGSKKEATGTTKTVTKNKVAEKVKEVEAEKEKEKTPEVEADPAEETNEEDPTITITEIRELLAKKVNDHRGEIKSELTKIGASSVTTMKESFYDGFYAFLQKLA